MRQITAAVSGKAKANFILEIPFMELGTVPDIDTMIAAFTTDIPALTNWGKPDTDRARLDSCGAHRRRVHREEATARCGRTLCTNRAPPPAERRVVRVLSHVQSGHDRLRHLFPRRLSDIPSIGREAAAAIMATPEKYPVCASANLSYGYARTSSAFGRHRSPRGSELFDFLQARYVLHAGAVRAGV